MKFAEARMVMQKLSRSGDIIPVSPGRIVFSQSQKIPVVQALCTQLLVSLRINSHLKTMPAAQKAYAFFEKFASEIQETGRLPKYATGSIELGDALECFAPQGHSLRRNNDGSWSFGDPVDYEAISAKLASDNAALLAAQQKKAQESIAQQQKAPGTQPEESAQKEPKKRGFRFGFWTLILAVIFLGSSQGAKFFEEAQFHAGSVLLKISSN